MNDFFRLKKKGFLDILSTPYCGIGATIRIGREMLCLPYAGFFPSSSGSFTCVPGLNVNAKSCITSEKNHFFFTFLVDKLSHQSQAIKSFQCKKTVKGFFKDDLDEINFYYCIAEILMKT